MNVKLFIEAIIKFLCGIILIGLLIFLPAGSLNYWNGWLFMGILFIPMFIAGIVMMIKSPELLKSRLNAKEKENEQREVVALSGLMFLAGFIVAGLNYRFEWITLPSPIVIIGTVLFLLSYLVYAEVLRENVFLSRTIEVQKNQKVIDTGLYGIVRHPMYMATILMYLSIPLILGSIFSLAIFLLYLPIITRRINDEEQLLKSELQGYTEYCTQVRWRLMPYIY